MLLLRSIWQSVTALCINYKYILVTYADIFANPSKVATSFLITVKFEDFQNCYWEPEARVYHGQL